MTSRGSTAATLVRLLRADIRPPAGASLVGQGRRAGMRSDARDYPHGRFLRSLDRYVSSLPLRSRDEWEQVTLDLWNSVDRREGRYAAVGVLWHPRYRHWAQAPASMRLYRTLIDQAAAAPCVDAVAMRGVALALALHPETETRLILGWSVQDDPRLRRAALRAQHRRHEQTDTRLLLHCVVANLSERDELVRSAIAPALLKYAHSGPPACAWVRAVLDELGSRVPRGVAAPVSRGLDALDHRR